MDSCEGDLIEQIIVDEQIWLCEGLLRRRSCCADGTSMIHPLH